jgi:peptidoglycan/LPS O-acetylase OafA/YrhL
MNPENKKITIETLNHSNSDYNTGLSAFLDAARWISALSVLITHINNRLFVALAEIPKNDRNALTYIWGFISGFAHWGVVVFLY